MGEHSTNITKKMSFCLRETTRHILQTEKQCFLLSEEVSYSIGEPGQHQDIPSSGPLISSSQALVDVVSTSVVGGDDSESTLSRTILSGIETAILSGMMILFYAMLMGIVGTLTYFLLKFIDSQLGWSKKLKRDQTLAKRIQKIQQEVQKNDVTEPAVHVPEVCDNNNRTVKDAKSKSNKKQQIEESRTYSTSSSTSTPTHSPRQKKRKNKRKQNNANPPPNTANDTQEEILEQEPYQPVPEFILNQNLNCDAINNESAFVNSSSPKKRNKKSKNNKKKQTIASIPGLSGVNHDNNSLNLKLNCASSEEENSQTGEIQKGEHEKEVHQSESTSLPASSTIVFVPGIKSFDQKPDKEDVEGKSNEINQEFELNVSPFATIMASKFPTFSLMDVDQAVKEVFRTASTEDLTLPILEKKIKLKMFKVEDHDDDEIYMSDEDVEDGDDEASAGTNTDDENNIDECLICLELLKDDLGYLMKCGHVFHNLCIKDWINKDETCPKCRTGV